MLNPKKAFGSFFLQSVCLSNHPNGPDSSPLVFHFSGLDPPIGFRISLRINPKKLDHAFAPIRKSNRKRRSLRARRRGILLRVQSFPRQVGEFAKIGFEEFGELRRGVFPKALQLTFASVIHRQVIPFVRILFQIIQFLLSVRIPYISPAFITQSKTSRIMQMSNRWMRPIRISRAQ